MKKILLACDTDNFPIGAFNFLEHMHQHRPFLLTGVFLHAPVEDLFFPPAISIDNPDLETAKADVTAVQHSIQLFSDRSIRSGMEFRIHEESAEYTVNELVRESRFADLLVLSEELFFVGVDKHQPNYYMKQVMRKAECPVLTVSEKFKTLSRIALTYDGSKESMYAIKHFSYLFPELTSLPTDVLYWVEDTEDEPPDMTYIEEYAARHFSNLRFLNKFFDKNTYLGTWAETKTDTLLVCGSYGRSGILKAFKKNFAEDLIEHPGPALFISHSS